MHQEITNKSIIRDFYRRAIGQGDIAFAETIIADDYMQHSASVKPGKAGLLEALQLMKQLPKPPTTSAPFMRLIAEDDYVVTNMAFGWGGKQKVVVDLFRFRDGKVVEHWDAIQDQSTTTLNGHAMMDGPREISDLDLTEPNKALVQKFFQTVFLDRQLDALPDFVAPDLIQHHPDMANGLAGLQAYLQTPATDATGQTVDRIIGEGNFVVVQSTGKQAQKLVTNYDVFRLSRGKIVEQWRVQQIAP
ncbi:nuclear transport factor 2 family protein [Spirosoma koreense]